MTTKLIAARDLHRRWLKDPAYVRAYDDLESEYSLISALIKARAEAGLTQEQLAKKMKTTRTAIVRLESGRQMPSTRTLERFAKATGHRLRISFEAAGKKSSKATPRRSA